MNYLTLDNGKDKLIMQRLTFGAGGFDDYTKKEEYFTLLDIYYGELGGRSFDTARAYSVWKKNGEGVSERVLGEWITSRKIKREDIVITTKGGFPFVNDYHKHRLDRGSVREDMEKSLEALGLDYMDIYLLHRDTNELAAGEMLETLNELADEGKTRFIGVSNWTAKRIEEANVFAKENKLLPFSISQINFSLAVTTPEKLGDDTVVCMNNTEYDWYLKNNFPIMAYSSQSKGYFSKLLSGKPLSDKCKRRFHTDENIKRAERVKAVSEKTGLSYAAVTVLYLACNGLSTSAIFCPSTKEQLRDTMSARDASLCAEDIKFLE